MSTALKKDQALCAPSVGTWYPAVGVGTPLQAGMRLGALAQLDRRRAIFAPEGVGGIVASVTQPGAWLSYGDPLLTVGDAIGDIGSTAAVLTQPSRQSGPEGASAICAETDGTVYLRPEPGAPTFIDVGKRVDLADTLALIEVMKTFTTVRATSTGEIVKVDVSDGQSVEAGAVLFWIK